MLHIGNKTYNLGIQKGKILYIGGNKLGPIIPDEVPSAWYNWKTDTNVSKNGETTLPYVIIPFVQKLGNKFVFSQHDRNAIQVRYSDDGINWNSSTVLSNTTQSFSQLTYNNGTYYCFLATDSSTIHRYSSSDLATWTDDGAVSGLNACIGMVYIQNTLWGYTNNNTCYYSNDNGMTWQSTSIQGGYEGMITSVNGIGFCGINSTNYMPYVTTDGVNWNPVTYSGTALGGTTYVAYGNGIYVMLNLQYNSGYYLYTRTSTDGVNWSDVTPLNNISFGTIYGRGYINITFVNGMFLVTAHDFNIAYYSADGVNWNNYVYLATSIDRIKGFLPVDNSKAILFNEQGSGSAGVSPIILVDNKECYTLDNEPTTSTVVYDNPGIQSELTVLEGGSQSITLSDNKIYNRNPSGDIII